MCPEIVCFSLVRYWPGSNILNYVQNCKPQMPSSGYECIAYSTQTHAQAHTHTHSHTHKEDHFHACRVQGDGNQNCIFLASLTQAGEERGRADLVPILRTTCSGFRQIFLSPSIQVKTLKKKPETSLVVATLDETNVSKYKKDDAIQHGKTCAELSPLFHPVFPEHTLQKVDSDSRLGITGPGQSYLCPSNFKLL